MNHLLILNINHFNWIVVLVIIFIIMVVIVGFIVYLFSLWFHLHLVIVIVIIIIIIIKDGENNDDYKMNIKNNNNYKGINWLINLSSELKKTSSSSSQSSKPSNNKNKNKNKLNTYDLPIVLTTFNIGKGMESFIGLRGLMVDGIESNDSGGHHMDNMRKL